MLSKRIDALARNTVSAAADWIDGLGDRFLRLAGHLRGWAER